MSMRIRALFACLVALALAAPVARGAEDLNKRLKAFTLTQADLPEGWSLQEFSDEDMENKAMLEFFKRIASELDGLAFKAQCLSASSATFPVFVFAYEEDHIERSIVETLKRNAKAMRATVFSVGKVTIMARTLDGTLVGQLKNAYGMKYASVKLDEVAALCREKKTYEAGEALARLAKEVPPSSAVYVRIARLYLDAFDPPKTDKAVEFFDKAVAEAKKADPSAYDLWSLYDGRAKAYEKVNMLSRAAVDYGQALKAAGEIGLRVKARTLEGLARVQALLGDGDASLATLRKALDIEAAFGSRRILERLKKTEAFAKVLARPEGAKLLQDFAHIAPREALADPDAGKVSLSKLKVLVAPPVVRRAGSRQAEWQEKVEKDLKRKFSRRGSAFGKKRTLLARLGLDTAAATLCEHGERSVVEDGNFDVVRYRGNRHGLADLTERLVRKAEKYGVARHTPGHVLAVTADLADGSLRVRAALYDVGGKRILLFADYTEPCPAKDADRALKNLGKEIHKKLDKAARTMK